MIKKGLFITMLFFNINCNLNVNTEKNIIWKWETGKISLEQIKSNKKIDPDLIVYLNFIYDYYYNTNLNYTEVYKTAMKGIQNKLSTWSYACEYFYSVEYNILNENELSELFQKAINADKDESNIYLKIYEYFSKIHDNRCDNNFFTSEMQKNKNSQIAKTNFYKNLYYRALEYRGKLNECLGIIQTIKYKGNPEIKMFLEAIYYSRIGEKVKNDEMIYEMVNITNDRNYFLLLIHDCFYDDYNELEAYEIFTENQQYFKRNPIYYQTLAEINFKTENEAESLSYYLKSYEIDKNPENLRSYLHISLLMNYFDKITPFLSLSTLEDYNWFLTIRIAYTVIHQKDLELAYNYLNRLDDCTKKEVLKELEIYDGLDEFYKML